MRWVNVVNGVKQRIGEILGISNVEEDEADNAPNYWSIQAAMLTNLRRIVKGISGYSAEGRPMEGCWITEATATTFNISSGLAFTNNGDIVVFPGVNGISLTGYGYATVRVYLKHVNAEIPQTTYPAIGKNTGLIGEDGTKEIINDDSAVGGADVVQLETDAQNNPDWVFIGTVRSQGFAIQEVLNSSSRGLAPNKSGDEFLLENIILRGDANFQHIYVSGQIRGETTGSNLFFDTTGQVTFNDIVVGGDADFTGADLFKLPGANLTVGGVSAVPSYGPANLSSITVKNGIITAISA